MRKQIIAIALMSMILSMTGCGKDSSTLVTSSDAETTTAVS